MGTVTFKALLSLVLDNIVHPINMTEASRQRN